MADAFTLETILPLARDRDSVAAFVCGYVGLRGESNLPFLEDCLTGDLFSLLDNCTVFDVCPDEVVRYRFCGTKVAERIGHEVTGVNMLEFLPAPMRESMYQDMTAMVSRPCGNYARYLNRFASGNGVETESISLPVQSQTDPDKAFVLALHLAEQKFVDVPLKVESQIGVEWLQSEFVDLGHGVPAHVTDVPIKFNAMPGA